MAKAKTTAKPKSKPKPKSKAKAKPKSKPKPTAATATVTPQRRRAIFKRWQKANPEPKTELAFETPFQLLIAVTLSAQATDVSVNAATVGLFQRAGNAHTLAAMELDEVIEYIKTIGLYNNKAKNILATAKILVEKYDGDVPEDREALEALPGVGRKTANVVLNEAFKQPTVAVDTHIFRVSNRTGIAPGKDVVAVENHLLEVVPDEFLLHAHHWLLLHGRYVCLARRPKCGECLISDLCEFEEKS